MLMRLFVALSWAALEMLCEKMETETVWTTGQQVTSPAGVEPTQAAVIGQTTESPWPGSYNTNMASFII